MAPQEKAERQMNSQPPPKPSYWGEREESSRRYLETAKHQDKRVRGEKWRQPPQRRSGEEAGQPINRKQNWDHYPCSNYLCSGAPCTQHIHPIQDTDGATHC